MNASTARPASAHRVLRPVTPVSIVAQRLAGLGAEIAAAQGAESPWAVELRELTELAGGMDAYLAQSTSPPSRALRELAEATARQDWAAFAHASGLEAEMLSGHVEGQTLRLLVHLTGARRVLEVGMFTGYSALAMAEALPDDGELVACEIDPDVAIFARRCFERSSACDRIGIRVGPARDTLRDLAAAGDPFDMVFIDADKPGYADYLDLILGGGLLAQGGLICADNTLFQGEVYRSCEPSVNGAAIRDFNRKVACDPRLEQVLLPLRDGLTLIRRV